MMRVFYFIIFLFSGITSFSQESSTSSQFSLNLLAPSAEYELAVSANSTIDFDLGVGLAYYNSSYSGEAFGVFPGLELQYRYYYNFEKRFDNGKKTSENSANYISGVVSVTGGKPIIGNLEYSNDYGGFIGPAWGLQRVYNSGFKLNLNLGLGLGFNDTSDVYLTPLFGLQLGWIITK